MTMAVHVDLPDVHVDSWFESLLVDISTRLIQRPPDQIESVIRDAQKMLCEHLNLDRSTLWQCSTECHEMLELTHFYHIDDALQFLETPGPSSLADSDTLHGGALKAPAYARIKASSFFPWIFSQLEQGRSVVLDYLDDLPPEAAVDRRVLERYETSSTVIVPLTLGTKLLGCISFATMHHHRNWSPAVVRRFELAAHLFTHALSRQTAARTLQENETCMRAIFDAADEGIVAISDQGIIESVNPAAQRLFGYAASELLGKTISLLLAQPSRREIEQFISGHQVTGPDGTPHVRRELMGRHKDGRDFAMDVSVSEVRIENRRLSTIFIRDITAGREAAQALRESEHRFRSIADSAPVLIWMSNTEKSFFFFNQRWLAFTGRSLAQEFRMGWIAGIHADDRQAFLERFDQAADRREPFELQFRLRRNDGAYRWLVTSGDPHYDPNGVFTGYIGSCTDVTEQKEAQKAAQDLSGLLIKAQEDQRARLARELHDDVTQRLARMAIDLGRYVQTTTLNKPEEALIRGVGEGLVRLSQDVHALSYQLHPSALIDLGLEEALRAECEEFSQRESVTAQLRLRDLPKAISREVALGLFRIAQEGLRNAVRHGRAGRIDITLWGVDNGLQLVVHDNGVGFHAGRTRNRPSLGLASMRERARLLNGDFEIESEPGHGTTVVSWIPV